MRRAATICVLLLCSLALPPAVDAGRTQRPASSKANNANGNNGNGKANGRDVDGADQVPPGQAEKVTKQKIRNGDQAGAVNLISTNPFDDETTPVVEGELIVKFKPGTTAANRGKALGKGKGAEKKMLRAGAAASGDLVLATVKDSKGNKPNRKGLKAAAANINSDPDVEYAEPNFIYTAIQSATPNDPYYQNGGLWGLMAGPGSNAAGAWAAGYQSCDGVVVGVIDTGIQVDHPDLKDAIWKNPIDTTADGKDNDGNGFTDDVNGWDFISYDASVYDDSNDFHGTHVSGTIGALGNNGDGVVGVCQRGVKIIPAKFLGTGGGNTANAVSALYYLLDLKKRYNLNMVATSNSWGGGGYSTSLEAAIRAHGDAGILFIAAAGNDKTNTDATTYYPSGYNLDNVISVGSITNTGDISSFSNYGATTVDLFAPGSNIWSTWPGNTYNSISGTSMATPHVTGAAALYAANYRRLTGTWPTASAIKTNLMNTGVSSGLYAGKSVSGKRLNVAALLATIPTATPSPSPATPSPSPAPRSPSPAPQVTASPSPALRSPSPGPALPSPSPAPPTVKRMVAQLSNTIYVDSADQWFYCYISISAIDPATNKSIPGIVINGTWGVNPDLDWYTDYYAEMPFNMYGNLGLASTGYTDSPWIPQKASLGSWYKDLFNAATYPGARCTFTLNSVTHPNYTLDKSQSTTYYESPRL